MTPNCTLRGKLTVVFALAGMLLTLPITASAADFVLTAGNWGKKQDNAVAAAGGIVNWSHKRAGIASVSSDNPDFLALVSVDNAFNSAAEDMIVEWQDENFAEAAITPGDETFYPLQWNMEAIDAEGAWDAGCTGAGARVAIIDGGIFDIHADLEPNLDKDCSASFVPGEPWNNDTGSFWHGTHVAGIVAAADNEIGVIGVAPEATLIGVKALHSGSGAFSWVIGAILYSADPAAFGAVDCAQADIINMSLGAIFNKRLPGGGPLVAAMNKAVNFAGSKGTLVVSAAGNDGIDLGQAGDLTSVPAESGSGLAIPATGPNDLAGVFGPPGDLRDPASYSNYGEGTSFVAAPGGQPGTTAVVDVNSPVDIAGTKKAASAAYGPPPSGETGDVVLWTDAADATGDENDACEPGIDPNVAGKIALIHRGSCAFVTKSANAEASGAIGVMISSNVPGPAPGLGGTLPGAAIPSVGITQADGADMEAFLPAPGVNVTLDDNPVGVFDQVVSSCRVGWCFAYGTSMASPAAAGVAALIKGANPDYSVGDLKAALKNSADDEGKIGHDEFYGHGHVNAARACTE
jgi:subtilisin family serine protease